MKIYHRIRVYTVGLLMGCVLVYFILIKDKNRGYWLPENRVKEQVRKSRIVFSEHAKCIITCKGISEEETKDVLKNGDVNFRNSDTHQVPCPSYVFEGKDVTVLCTVCDSISEVINVIRLNEKQDTCLCP